jgi:hypothetical protein
MHVSMPAMPVAIADICLNNGKRGHRRVAHSSRNLGSNHWRARDGCQGSPRSWRR